MITVGSVDSVRNLPATALFGSQLVFFFIMAAIFFLIPAALVSAELAAAWPKQGGIYVWVKEAFGSKAGFVAIWLQWIENIIWYPTLLSFVAGTIGYIINPELAHNVIFLVSVILVAFWGATLINLNGMKTSAAFSTLCTISGLLIPMALIIALGVTWVVSGNPLQIDFSWHGFMPNMHNPDAWVALTGIILSYCGIEIATVHAGDVVNPQRDFPRALLYSVAIILSTLVLGALAIAVVLPEKDISLVAGIMQAFSAFFKQYHMSWCLPIIAFMLVMGGLGGINNWIIAPTKGLLVAAQDGHLPVHMREVNEHGAPSVMLFYQAIIVSLMTIVFLMMPSVNGSYWLLTVIAAQLYMLMYLMMFATVIKLHFKRPEVERPFKIPGGRFGLILFSLLGCIGCITTIVVGFIPPSNIDVGSASYFEEMVIAGLVLMLLPPFILRQKKSRRDAFRDDDPSAEGGLVSP